jgi:hypothetical protein
MRTILVILFVSASLFGVAQDKIKLKTGEVVKCRVYKIANGKVSYRKMHNLKGPELFYSKSDVEYIKYENGKVVFMEGNKMKKPAVKKKTTTKPKGK